MALAMRMRSAVEGHFAGRMDANLHRVVAADAPADRLRRLAWRTAAIDESGEAYADEFAPRAQLRLLAPERGVVRHLQDLVEQPVRVGRVVGDAKRGLVRKICRLQHVAATDLDDVEPKFACRIFQQPLDHIYALRASGAPIGLDRNGMRVDGPHPAMDGGDAIEP